METKQFSFGPFQLDSAKRLLQRDSKPVPLSSKAFETLLFLIRNRERLVKKDELMTVLWPDTTVEENNLSQSISAIRKALGDSAQEHLYIETVPGWGYRFAAQVTAISEEGLVPVAGPGRLPLATRGSDKKIWISGMAITLVLVTGAAFYAASSGRRGSQQRGLPSQVLPARRSVAVLGFENLSADRKPDAWLSTALSEMLSTELAVGGTVRIISTEDVARVKAELPLHEAGSLLKTTLQQGDRNFGSDFLIFGSYVAIVDKKRGGRQIRLDLRLASPKSGEMIAEFAETGAESDLFDLVSRAGVRLRQKLGVPDLSPTEAGMVRAALPASSQATQFYAEGLEKLRVFDAVDARNQLLKAIALDPKYPMAHSALGDAWSTLGYDAKAAEEAREAFQLSRNLSPEEQLSVEGRYRTSTHQWNKAVEVYQSLVALFPDDLDYGLRLAAAQTWAAKVQDSLATLDRLRSLPSPLGDDPRIDLLAAEAWYSLGDFKRMEGSLQRANQNAQTQGHLLLLARAKNQQCHAWRFLGKVQNAIGACREAQRIYSATGDRGAEADTLRLLGDVVSNSDVAGAMGLYQKALTIQRQIGHLFGQASVLNQIAILYSVGGDHPAAERSLEQALAIFRRLDDQVRATGMLINIGYELSWQGRPQAARTMYENTRDTAVRLGNKDIQGLATYDLACIDQLRGELDRAQEEFREAGDLFQSVEDKTQLTMDLSSLGDIAMSKGDYQNAQRLYESAFHMGQSLQQKVLIAESQLNLALLSLEKGDPAAQVEKSVRQAIEDFRAGKSLDDEATATALLARVLFLQEKRSEAREMSERALSVSRQADPHVRLSVGVTAARIRAAADQAGTQQIIASLENMIAEAQKLGYFGIELDARLALGEVEMKSGAITQGRAHLQALRRDASQRGFKVLAGKAAAAAA
jgi:DNA-binding winged helix-turn-helix (wHTH) protein/tetratricopeptide (TPR) repeat protein